VIGRKGDGSGCAQLLIDHFTPADSEFYDPDLRVLLDNPDLSLAMDASNRYTREFNSK